jgi:hypothetical protein
MRFSSLFSVGWCGPASAPFPGFFPGAIAPAAALGGAVFPDPEFCFGVVMGAGALDWPVGLCLTGWAFDWVADSAATAAGGAADCWAGTDCCCGPAPAIVPVLVFPGESYVVAGPPVAVAPVPEGAAW